MDLVKRIGMLESMVERLHMANTALTKSLEEVQAVLAEHLADHVLEDVDGPPSDDDVSKGAAA